ncbi:MAG: recombinase family protein [Candidatus Polarisedimenticolia bacterium]
MKPAPDKLPDGRPCVLYLRRSTDRQEQSIDDQRSYLQRFATENDFEIVDEFVDDGISGTNADARGGFQRMIREAQGKARFRAILVYDIKRFSRGDVDEAGYYRHLLRQRNIDVVYATENFGDDFTSELIRPMRQWQARQESVDLSRLTARGQMSSVQAGSYFGSTAPWAYDYMYSTSRGEPFHIVRYLPAGEKDVLSPDGTFTFRVPYGERPPRMDNDSVRLVLSLPERVETVRNIFDWCVNEGLGGRAIANRLNRVGITSPRSGWWGNRFYHGKWNVSSVAHILRRPVYTGDTVWNRVTQGKFHRIVDGRSVARTRQKSGRSEKNSREDWIVAADTHPAIVSREVFAAAQRILDGRREVSTFKKRLSGRARSSNYLLSRLITCELCGHHLSGWTHKIRRKTTSPPADRPQYYLCQGYLAKGNSVCRRAAFEKEPLEAFVIEQVRRRLMQLLDGSGMADLRRYVREELEQAIGTPGTDLKAVEEEMSRVAADIDRLIDSITPVNKDLIDERLVQLKNRRRQLEDRREELSLRAERKVDLEAATNAALAYLTRFREVLATGTFLEQKEFLSAFVERITLHPVKKSGTLKIRDMVAASFCISGWNRMRLYRSLRRYGIPYDSGRDRR